VDKKGDPRSMRWWNGLEDAIKDQAVKEGRTFTEMVNHLCDRGLYFSGYRFPFHKPKFSTMLPEEEEKSGR
jgi:hypothetical protein